MQDDPEKLTQGKVELPTGHQVIAGYLKTLDASPGVYRMLDAQARVLYVGKARNLRARVSNYSRPTGHSARIARMIRETASMMFLTTRTETEALLLEQNLIKQLKPRYNVLLRDDKSFPNILVTDHPFPMIKKHRGARKEKGSYYGPFASAGAVNRSLAQLQRVFLLRNCSDAMFESRTRPCLQFQIKRCTAPCVGKISEEDYAEAVRDAERYLSGRSTEIQEKLATDMQAASDALEFEKAAALRDRIKALTQVQTAQGINPRSTSEADVIALHLENGQACVQVFFIRANQNWGNRDFYPRVGSAEIDEAEVLEAFIGQFYATKEPPKQLLLSHAIENADLMTQALSEKAGRKVELLVPQRGEKAELVSGAERNARESLARKMAETATQAKLLKGLADAFSLDAPPGRIEVYDNSHIQGAHAVGAMIVAGPDGLMKNQYRKFNIRGDDLTPGDDFGMMKEVLKRRFKRLLKEDPDRAEGHWPDLLLIDGGAGQVSAVASIMAEIGVSDIPMVGVAKGIDRDAGKEEFHRQGARPFALRHNDPVLYFIQRLRDEAHRFAIGTHRAKRAKAIGATPLDDVPGVGATRKRALLAHFGSAKAVSRAALADLKAVDGVSDNLAETIYDFFHENG
ncbi:excinuclease ABC subunit UvrC [Alisedimentitalea sp. MJ-SS2]|uniref:excinuclease ABC subunit UvrC n=1 Tax=Aliisedimentitalea sp. MJ-SS2 TaxID=3049795 RepID=UPI002912ED52|nr:excinuclease ABC subunit UvrC [Alisedimentitalea sp. MJ-SS2]MDU8928475.1 excinuclease ABC subunit UvrC [Alisedimentitalea sp. MJ-SS2]